MSGWGIEATHTWDGALALGDRSVWPRLKLTKIAGLRALGDLDVDAEQASGRRGEVPRSAQRSGKTVVYSGTIQARDLAEMRAAEESMLAAFDTTSEREMVIAPDPAYASGSRSYAARCIECEIDDEQRYGPRRVLSGGYERDFDLTLRLSDPRIYDAAAQTQASTAGANQTTNLATNPRAGSGLASGWALAASPMDTWAPALPLPAAAGLPSGVDSGFAFAGSAADDCVYLPVAVASGTQYTASFYVLLTTLTATGLYLLVQTAAAATVATSTSLTQAGPWVRLSCTFTAAASESYRVGIAQSGAGASGGYATALQVEAAATASRYFDGSSPEASWSGAASASSSVRRPRRDAVATCAADTIDTDPVITIAGSAGDPVLRHRELDRYLSFEGRSITAGQSIVCDFAQRSITLNGSVPLAGWLDRAASDWWDAGIPGLIPAANTIELYRSGSGEATVAWRDAHPA